VDARDGRLHAAAGLLTLGKHRDFDKLTGTGRQDLVRALGERGAGPQMLLAKGMAADLYDEALRLLVSDGVLLQPATTRATRWH
jgi:DEAD/DEAH box helicase domain-containing protein